MKLRKCCNFGTKEMPKRRLRETKKDGTAQPEILLSVRSTEAREIEMKSRDSSREQNRRFLVGSSATRKRDKERDGRLNRSKTHGCFRERATWTQKPRFARGFRFLLVPRFDEKRDKSERRHGGEERDMNYYRAAAEGCRFDPPLFAKYNFVAPLPVFGPFSSFFFFNRPRGDFVKRVGLDLNILSCSWNVK